MLDQRVLPTQEEWLELKTYQDVVDAIKTMAVRGAPAIGVAAAYGLALAALHSADRSVASKDLAASRPTAVNLFWAIDRINALPVWDFESVLSEAKAIESEDLAMNPPDFGPHLRERIKAITGGKGVDVVYDPVGGPYTELALRSTAWRGRLLVIGFAAGDIPKIPLNLALLKGCSIVGVFWGDFTKRQPKEFVQSVVQLGTWFREGKLKPHITASFPLEKAADALKMMASRQVKGKVVLIPG
jgi:hypothetical protein